MYIASVFHSILNCTLGYDLLLQKRWVDEMAVDETGVDELGINLKMVKY